MMVNKGMYVALCFFAGGIGLHKFYAGKWFQGLLYVALLSVGVSPVLALLDLLVVVFRRTNDYGEIRV